ncbi:hypothetical protein [Angustibacter luteus]|uniref:ABC transporter permease n=1 Tax=Angustibacter luteus TaxID=658456 RepID=A0ABW1JEZ5_9ACTN
MSHAVTAARLHLVTWRSAVIWPWAVLASSFVINWVIQALLDPGSRQQSGTGGIASLYFVAAWLAYQAVSQVFPFALGMGVTRKAFAAGTGALLALQAGLFAAALTILRYLESATGGFGVELNFFRVPGLRQDDPVLQLLVYAAPFLLLGTLLMGMAVVQHRWRQGGMIWLAIGSVVVVGGLVALITWLAAWHDLWDWFQDTSALVTLVLIPVALAVALAGAGYRLLLNATP